MSGASFPLTRRRVRSWRVVESRGPVVAERPRRRPIRCARLAVAGLVVGGDGRQAAAGADRRCPRQAEISRFSADGLRAQPGGRPRRQRRRLRVAIRQAQVHRAGPEARPVGASASGPVVSGLDKRGGAEVVGHVAEMQPERASLCRRQWWRSLFQRWSTHDGGHGDVRDCVVISADR